MYLKISFLTIIVFIISCQPIEIISPVEFDNSRFEKISISAKDVSINTKYDPIFSQENIEDQLEDSPIEIIQSWLGNNISHFGNQNKFIINIMDASISKKEVENVDAKKYEEKTVFQYDVFFLVEYQLYDDNEYLLASATVESSRSTTSQKYVSINETEIIINDLLSNTLNDFINETKSVTKIYMSEYLK